MAPELTGDTGAARVARIGIGTAQFGLAYGVSNTSGQVSIETAAAILKRAKELGITHLDTAPAYGNSEVVLGGLPAAAASFAISTKTVTGTADAAAVAAGIARSAEHLGRHPLDIVLIHDATQLLGPRGDGLWRALMLAQDQGLVREIGISAYTHHDPLALAQRFRPQVMQLPLSLLDQRLITDGTLARLKDLGVTIHARSIFLQGLPFMDADKLPPRIRSVAPRLAAISHAIEAQGLSVIEALTGFALDQPEIDVAVIGVTGVTELDEIADAARKPLPKVAWGEFTIDDATVLTPSLWWEPAS